MFFSLIVISSCKDSLGYDPNVQVTEILRDSVIKPPDDNNPRQFVVDSIRTVFNESYKHNGRYFEIPWFPKTINRKIVMDTSAANKMLWIDWTVESNNSDNDYRGMNRMDRVAGFELNFSALIENRRFNLDGTRERNRWFKLLMKKFMNGSITEFSENSLKATLVILDIDRANGTMRIMLESEIPFNAPFQTKRFSGIIDIFYKK